MDDFDTLVSQVMDDGAAGAPPDPQAGPASDGGSGPGDSPDDVIAAAEAEALAAITGEKPQTRQAKAAPEGEGDEPAPAGDPSDPLERIIKDRFKGDRKAAADYFSANPDRLSAIESAIQQLRTPPADPQAQALALEKTVQEDEAVVGFNREIDSIDKTIENTHRENARILKELTAAEREADKLEGKSEVAADDQKAGFRAGAEAKKAEAERLRGQYLSNQDTLRRAGEDKKHYERRLASRVDEIQAEVADRVNSEARAEGQRAAILSTFDDAVAASAKDLKLNLSSFQREAIRGVVVAAMKKADTSYNWSLQRIASLTDRVTRRFAEENRLTAGSRAATLPVRAPSAPRPASQRVASPAPASDGLTVDVSKMSNSEKVAFFKGRARRLEAAGVGVGRR